MTDSIYSITDGIDIDYDITRPPGVAGAIVNDINRQAFRDQKRLSVLSALQIFRTRIISADSSAKTQEYTPTGRSADRCPNCRTTLMWKTGAIFRLPYNISVAVTAA